MRRIFLLLAPVPKMMRSGATWNGSASEGIKRTRNERRSVKWRSREGGENRKTASAAKPKSLSVRSVKNFLCERRVQRQRGNAARSLRQLCGYRRAFVDAFPVSGNLLWCLGT